MAVLLHVMRNLEGVVVGAGLDADHRDRAAAIEDLTQERIVVAHRGLQVVLG